MLRQSPATPVTKIGCRKKFLAAQKISAPTYPVFTPCQKPTPEKIPRLDGLGGAGPSSRYPPPSAAIAPLVETPPTKALE
jgi:hypothetical protein